MSKHKYQDEYENSKCFWGTEPAKYVVELSKILNNNFTQLNVLDLGAGEGKNSVFFANHGANVTAVDLSKLALSRFDLQPGYEISQERIHTIVDDISNLDFEKSSFDIVIAYGVLHCLHNINEINNMINKIKGWIQPKGYFVGATFTNKIAIPQFQNYLENEALLPVGKLQEIFNDWNIIECEDDIITETHPTSQIEHQHSIVRIIARNKCT